MTQKVDLKEGLLDRKVNIALVQLESPFYGKLNSFVDEKNKRKIFQWHETESAKKKIISILENIKVKTDPKTFPDIIVFPEYSIPYQILPEIEDFSKDYKIIIAGSDQIRDPQNEMYLKNVSPIIIQDMGTFFVEKNSLSEEELGIVQAGTIEKSTLELHWRTSGEKELCLQIFICLDFLDNNCLMDKSRKGCIVVPMCSKSMKEFVGHQYTDVRYGKFVLFSNVVTLNGKEPIMVGSSAVYGAGKERDKRDAIISLNDSLEGVIFVKLDAEHPGLTKPTAIPSTKPVEFSKAYKITSNYELKPIISEKTAKKVAIINPDLFEQNVKLPRFFFLKAIEYGKFKRNIRRLHIPKFNSFGVLGDYDTISMSFLDAEDELKRRSYLERYTVRGGLSCIEVKKIYKFYGLTPCAVPNEVLNALPGDFLVYDQLRSLSEDWDTPDVSENEKEKLLQDKLILGAFERSDLRAENLLRAFICLELPEHNTKQAILFEEKIIEKYLCSLDSVKSLYKTTASTGFKSDFLLDIIDTSYSIFDTIIEIHLKSNNLGIDVLTNTYVVVEQLSQGLFKNLSVKHLEIYGLSIEYIIKMGESEMIEFKSSLKWDYRKNSANKEIAFFVAKTISSFMNYKGGILLIGVKDEGELLGLDKDFSTLKKHDKDGFEIELTSVLNKYLGKEFRHLVTAFFEDINEKSVCKVEVKPSPKPVYLRRDKGSEFYIRAGNSSQPLDMEEANEYISMHWKK